MLRYVLLGLLDAEPRYGYELKAVFEQFLGGTWPLNIGQVYTTLARAERDGLVAQLEVDDEGRVVYEITAEGRHEVAAWYAQPVRREAAPRDELAIKLAVAVTAPGVDVEAIVQTQRGETMRTLQQLTRLKMDADEDADLLDPLSWAKSPQPVFQSDYAHRIYGPGHNSFTVAEDGVTDLLVYHARTYTEIVGDPLWDPNRHTFMKRVNWSAEGRPSFDGPHIAP